MRPQNKPSMTSKSHRASTCSKKPASQSISSALSAMSSAGSGLASLAPLDAASRVVSAFGASHARAATGSSMGASLCWRKKCGVAGRHRASLGKFQIVAIAVDLALGIAAVLPSRVQPLAQFLDAKQNDGLLPALPALIAQLRKLLAPAQGNQPHRMQPGPSSVCD